MTLVPFVQAELIGDRFLTLLSRLDIKPRPRSLAEHELLSLVELIDVLRDPNLANGPDQGEILRRAAGLHDFAAKILCAEGLPEFQTFVPHLKLLGQNVDSFSTLIQNARAILPNDVNRKLTELYIASLAIHLAGRIEVDSPSAAQGDNPDIIFSYVGDHLAGRLWALAIKSVSGESGQTYFERIRDAARQIDAPACRAQIGMVVVNLKDTLDHNALWRTPFPDLQTAVDALHAQIYARIDRASADRPQSEWDALFERKVVRPILFMAHALVRIARPDGTEVPTVLKAVIEDYASGSPDEVGREIAVALNHMMQTLLEGAPGSPIHLPY